MEIENKLFINKFQPKSFEDFNMEDDTKKILNTLISIDNLNILLIGDIA